MNRQQTQMLFSLIEKIQTFEGLSFSQAERLLKVCRYKSYEAGAQVYQYGDPSLEMLILLKGHLRALGKTGTTLGDIYPGTCCGEMGVFTGLTRSATVTAVRKSAAFVMRKQHLSQILKEDMEMKATILQNVVNQLSERIVNAGAQIETYAGKLQRSTEEIGMLEQLEEGWKPE